ncbi:conserved hypothetical protein [Histoplasma capsulatum H143]|uniref:Uncharacterized protein n=1 Tax=Ajellomyces capsulatus (strain H143) TaxID=544712 RepID=C6HH49_AJECH|nr:conserved hypothetical protein [Histoplasma capsulatum H143]
MSLSNLKVNGLYIILFIRHHPPVQDNFHWGLYLHHHSQTSSTKYHIKQQSTDWITDHRPTAGVFKSFLLMDLFRITNIPAGWEGHLLLVLALLQKSVNSQVILKCDNLAALKAEVKTWGNSNTMATAVNEQPRPIKASALCRL